MNEESIRHLLSKVADGDCDVDQALDQLRTLPYEDLDFARLDHHHATGRAMPTSIGNTRHRIGISIFVGSCTGSCLPPFCALHLAGS